MFDRLFKRWDYIGQAKEEYYTARDWMDFNIKIEGFVYRARSAGFNVWDPLQG